jgi:hypothetical protein
MKLRAITFEFVEVVPLEREERKLYISTKYRTAIHSCFCGCGLKVVTPIRPAKWRLIYDGDSVSLLPSVGNWGFPCRSHYWIKRNYALPAGYMTDKEVAENRGRDLATDGHGPPPRAPQIAKTPSVLAGRRRFWNRLKIH